MIFRPPHLILLLAAGGAATPGCADDACERGEPSMEIAITLRSGVAREEIASLLAKVRSLSRLKTVELGADKLRRQGRATFVIVVGQAGSKGFRVEAQVVAKNSGGQTIANGEGTFDGVGDACNFYSLLLTPIGSVDGGPPPEDSAGLDRGVTSDQDARDIKITSDAKVPCGPLTCAGCCNSIGVCMPGDVKSTCGKNGGKCNNCIGLSAQNTACISGACQTCSRGRFSCGAKDACACVGRCGGGQCLRTCDPNLTGQCGSVYHQCVNSLCQLCPRALKNCDRMGDCKTSVSSSCPRP